MTPTSRLSLRSKTRQTLGSGTPWTPLPLQPRAARWIRCCPSYQRRAALQEVLDRYQVLGPPGRFVADHERTEQYFEDQIDALTRQQAAADVGN
jgi:hypothetical protein